MHEALAEDACSSIQSSHRHWGSTQCNHQAISCNLRPEADSQRQLPLLDPHGRYTGLLMRGRTILLFWSCAAKQTNSFC